jgi:hypothetical protein
MMMPVREFAFPLSTLLPETHALLLSANLTVHPSVSRVTLHGSRGLARRWRTDSDIDLSLLVDIPRFPEVELELLLAAALEVTQTSWSGPIELDLAVVFDVHGCGLRCFEQTAYQASACPQGGLDCFGLYKRGKGFDGFVTGAGIQVARMYPCLVIWRREVG